jgi:A/G-specific adenine glycosylase
MENPVAVTEREIQQFKETVIAFYQQNKRIFPWRGTTDPYKIFISEVMLQQTQTERVVEKYLAFVRHFPDFESLANSTLQEVFSLWHGLGYNRRAKYLREAALIVDKKYGGILPEHVALVDELPGIGYATACAICTYAFNFPTIYIETNIRSVFIHYFFSDSDEIADSDIYPLVERSLDRANPRDWYYALMDYGVMIKKTVGNPNKKSKHYTKQSSFKDSNRRVRGMIMKVLNENKTVEKSNIYTLVDADKDKIQENLNTLIKEMMIREENGAYSIS